MYKGILYALSACFIWGLIFIVPQFMGSFNSMEIALGRYIFYGSFSLLFLFKGGIKSIGRYPLSTWLKAFYLSLLSGYYLWVILAIRYTSPAICALILGISPIVIAFYSIWKEGQGNLKSLILPSALIVIGLLMINAPNITMAGSPSEYAIGLCCCVVALLSWSLYVILNSRFLKNNPQVVSNDWATMQGVTTLLWTLVIGIICSVLVWEEFEILKYFNLNIDSRSFLIGCATLGLLCSWVGGYLWNKASLFLPVSLAGQLMIFETVFGILFFYLLERKMPPWLEFTGIFLLLGSVIYGIRTIKESHYGNN